MGEYPDTVAGKAYTHIVDSMCPLAFVWWDENIQLGKRAMAVRVSYF